MFSPDGDDRRRNRIFGILRPAIRGKDRTTVSVVTRRDGNCHALFLQEGIDLVAQDAVFGIGQGKRRRCVIPFAFAGAPAPARVAIERGSGCRACCSAPAATPVTPGHNFPIGRGRLRFRLRVERQWSRVKHQQRLALQLAMVFCEIRFRVDRRPHRLDRDRAVRSRRPCQRKSGKGSIDRGLHRGVEMLDLPPIAEGPLFEVDVLQPPLLHLLHSPFGGELVIAAVGDARTIDL